MLKTYQGSCHCGAVAFDADLDLAAGAARCNCSYCRKARSWNARAAPENLRVVTGEDHISTYDRAGTGAIVHCFCKTCGIRLFTRADIPEMGGKTVTIALSALNDATPEELIAAPLMWCDGLHDNWWNPPEEVRHL